MKIDDVHYSEVLLSNLQKKEYVEDTENVKTVDDLFRKYNV